MDRILTMEEAATSRLSTHQITPFSRMLSFPSKYLLFGGWQAVENQKAVRPASKLRPVHQIQGTLHLHTNQPHLHAKVHTMH